MDKTVLVNQIVIMKALRMLMTDEKTIKELNGQIQFTEARLRALA